MATKLFPRPPPSEIATTTRKLVTVAINTVLSGLTLGRRDPTPSGRAIRRAARQGALAAVAQLLPPDGRRPVGRPPKVALSEMDRSLILFQMGCLINGGRESEFEPGGEPPGYVAPVRPPMSVAKAAAIIVAEKAEKKGHGSRPAATPAPCGVHCRKAFHAVSGGRVSIMPSRRKCRLKTR